MSGGLQPGALFARRYQVVRCIGMGGMGAVYEVIHQGTQRHRALKVLLPGLMRDDDSRERFAQEASITAKIDSEHLVDVFDAAVDDETGSPYIVMELLRGYSLGKRLEDKRRFSASEVVDLLTQVAGALDQTHAAGIVHRDLKPDNLFVITKPDGSALLKILDFGIAKAMNAGGANRNTANIGTPLYMAPEQLDGSQLDGRADLYSLGHIAFELLTGENYWEQELRALPSTMALLRAMDRGCPEPPSYRAGKLGVRVGPAFDAWFHAATARSPQQRYSTARALVSGFATAIGLRPIVDDPTLPAGYVDGNTTLPLGTVPRPHEKDAKSTGGPGVWGMATPRTARRAQRTRVGVAVAGAAIAGMALAALAVRGGLGKPTAATSAPTQTAEATGETAIEPTPTPEATAEPAATPSVTPSASGIASAPTATASSAAAGSAKGATPSVKPTTTTTTTTNVGGAGARPPTQAEICRRDPRRCR